MRRVVLYCPDRHLRYDHATPERRGVGGGVTARVRLAAALAELGSEVTLVGNVPSGMHGKLRLRSLDETTRLEGDLLILNSTGGKLDLSPVAALEVEAPLRLVWIGGEARVAGLDAVRWDAVVAPSNFLRRQLDVWGIPPDKRQVIPNGVPAAPARRWPWPRPRRDPFRLVYASHPDKGIGAALALLRRLRAVDPRFTLHVYGGRALWGQPEAAPPAAEGVVWHGLVGQRELGRALERATFSLHLQGIADGFGLALAEAQAAGCIVLASRIGAYPELVRDGWDGFLFDGPHEDDATLARAAEAVLALARGPELRESIGRRAAAAPLTWGLVAKAWLDLADRLGGGGAHDASAALPPCAECGGRRFVLADGTHCGSCGRYDAALA